MRKVIHIFNASNTISDQDLAEATRSRRKLGLIPKESLKFLSSNYCPISILKYLERFIKNSTIRMMEIGNCICFKNKENT